VGILGAKTLDAKIFASKRLSSFGCCCFNLGMAERPACEVFGATQEEVWPVQALLGLDWFGSHLLHQSASAWQQICLCSGTRFKVSE
jgi:hypothetical protein